MNEKEKMLAGELYDASDQVLIQDRLIARKLLYRFNASPPDAMTERLSILGELINTSGPLEIEPPFYCDYGYNITVGNEFYANFNCTILDVNKVTIGDHVMLGPNVQIYTASHPLIASERIKGPEFALPITIGNRVWLGGGVIICPGVTIGENTTIGAGSVVTKDIPSNVFAAGNPCKIIRMLD